jgi:hypothetical protein
MWDWSYWPMPHFFFDPLFMIVFLVCMIMMMWVMRGHRYGGSHALDILILFFNGTVIWGLVQSSRVLVLKRSRRFEGGTDVQTYSDSDRRI